MRLHEYQSKEIFTEYHIPIPQGRLAATPEEAKLIAEELHGSVVLKAQVLTGGRGKAGGIRLVHSPDQAEEEAAKILGERIKGLPVRRLLVEEAINIQQEIYFGMTVDRQRAETLVIASGEGGVDIETVAQASPEKIARVGVDPLLGLREFQARNLAAEIEVPRRLWRPFISPGAQPVPGLPKPRRHPGRDQPPGDHGRGAPVGAGRQDRPRRQRPVPPPGIL
jgi:succinyl-CoA synthetase beta subunit